MKIRINETQLKRCISETICEYLGADEFNEITSALVACGVRNLSGRDFIKMIADAAAEDAKYDFIPEHGESEGIYDADVLVDGEDNDIGGDFPEPFYMEANVHVLCHEERDREDYFTPPYSETFIDGYEKASMYIYNEGDLVYKGDITNLIKKATEEKNPRV